jgi:hypothetical protein
MKVAAVLGVSTLLVMAPACSRTGLVGRDAGGPDLPPSDVRPNDGRPGDATRSDVVTDAATAFDLRPRGCASLVNNGVLNLGRAKQALFAPDGSSVLLRIGNADSDATDVAMLLRLDDGASRVLGRDVGNVEWLGRSAALLAAADRSRLVAVSLDGEVLLTVPTQTCSHAATPDGSRIYYTHPPCDSVEGALSVVDLALGTSRQLTDRASTGSLTMSPDSRFAAYVAYTGPRDMPASSSAVFVADAAGSTYNVAGPRSAWGPVFAPGGTLLFRSAESGASASTIWRHAPGTGSRSQSLTEGDIGITGYEIAEDGSGFLMARFPGNGQPGELLLAPLDGGNTVRLATNLMDYRMYSMPYRPFAFARPGKRVLFIADSSGDAGRSYGIASVSRDGSDRVQLATGSTQAVVSSHADRVAIVSIDYTLRRGTLSVVSSTGANQLSIPVAGSVLYGSFVPQDRGLLFVEEPTGANKQLRHLSFASGKVTTLAEWTTSQLPLYAFPAGVSFGGYPIDPSGCFTVVDSDLDQTGARLVALPD